MIDETASGLWSRDNLHAWEIANWDLERRTPAERARMLRKAGIRHYAYLPSTDPQNQRKDLSHSHLDIEAEIEAMLGEGIEIRAWFFWVNKDDPADEAEVPRALKAFAKYDIHPQIWVPPSYGRLQPEPLSIESVQDRLDWEAGRIAALADLARPYACRVHLYGHWAWMGRTANLLTLLARLHERGLTDTGIVYNIPHAHAAIGFPDDAEQFDEIWPRLQPHVVAVNTELTDPLRAGRMMRTIQDSGWHGPVGVFTAMFSDAELVLQSALYGVEWALAEHDRA
jgi:hypothetical protein